MLPLPKAIFELSSQLTKMRSSGLFKTLEIIEISSSGFGCFSRGLLHFISMIGMVFSEIAQNDDDFYVDNFLCVKLVFRHIVETVAFPGNIMSLAVLVEYVKSV